ncbi:MAG TPA: 4Fe-4S ferredoxin [Elusimicrobia bacterium]|nr:MAG: hypothetical protein A2278_07950 [Elusimicrobia bacterium RIFOXYA12_FULL_49_49]OGS10187.1 MAG: hypothetical protein A2204_04270 [Elusimicrobia bacterium RIFOXYA1_FULL_47_7]OGS11808.1 MAG: hypothetical protein A2386_02220 [Elusimicrobia bacterium RIFOXYB1_FULL_48_9]OGS16004.1 MAG: hypothetical protein A2251_02315 [Elusimicrobia bacterium RIFOXYA2_FULL_47_53]OGS26316.1 MAG: hypothetical protein A2339_02950 [Elusimicrobia bacterium RIFOXYB12_FULL_50_12]OGS29172.1 MAG: hypothetical protein
MKYPKLRELKEAITALIKGPYTTKFPAEPHVAMPGFRGKPTPDKELCIACGACAEVCPARAIEVKNNTETSPKTRDIIWHYDLCIYCGQCERLCTTQKGVTLTQEYDLATTDRSTLYSGVQKELVVCQDCGEIIGTKDQLLWIYKKIGPLTGGNYNIIFTAQNELGLSSEDSNTKSDKEQVQRADLYRLLCPKCRHVALVFNQTGKQI